MLNVCFVEGDEDAPAAVITAKAVVHPRNAREFADTHIAVVGSIEGPSMDPE